MPDAARRSALEGCALPTTARATAVALPFATRLVLRGDADAAAAVEAAFGVQLPTKPLTSAAVGARAALWLGPDEWLLIAEESAAGLAGELERALGGVFHTLVDVSHRQAGIWLEGPGAARLIGTGCPLDLDLVAFPVGMATRTLLVKAEIVLWRPKAEGFHIEFGRSFAPYVAQMLVEASRDQGAD